MFINFANDNYYMRLLNLFLQMNTCIDFFYNFFIVFHTCTPTYSEISQKHKNEKVKQFQNNQMWKSASFLTAVKL